MGCPLYIRSVYTLLSSMCTISKIISKAKEYGYASVGLVDRNVLSGSMAFKKEALKNGIKPIFGLEFDIEIDSRIYTMLLYSKNDDGFKNLMSLSSYINTSENKVINIDILNEYRNNNYLVLLVILLYNFLLSRLRNLYLYLYYKIRYLLLNLSYYPCFLFFSLVRINIGIIILILLEI